MPKSARAEQSLIEASRTFSCFGGNTTVVVEGAGSVGEPGEAVIAARDLLLVWHAAFSRFKPESELSRLNGDERTSVPVTAIMARFVQSVVDAAQATGGLVDATMLEAIEGLGYKTERFRGSLALPLALALAPARQPARAHPDLRWRTIKVDFDTSTVTLADGAVATTSITKRSWMERLKPAHHLLDPATGLPAYTGIVQTTALAPTALEAS